MPSRIISKEGAHGVRPYELWHRLWNTKGRPIEMNRPLSCATRSHHHRDQRGAICETSGDPLPPVPLFALPVFDQTPHPSIER
ncbi:MAG: hypothetical protein K8L91_17575 [Anaerolineae bacterium]|nr:hypothetical protein [Anaerolineae bacterium]